MSSIKQKAIRGTLWTVFGYGTSQTLRFGGNLILTRLLMPEMFGLMALVNTFIQGLSMFSDIGIGPSLIQNKRGNEPDFFNTAWTIQVLRGWGLWLCCLIITWPVAQFYKEPRLLWILPVAGLNTILNGFNSTVLVQLNRNIELGRLTRLDLSIQSLGLMIMIVWAYYRHTIWALLGGGLVSNAVKMFWSHRLNPKIINRFTWDKEAVHDLITFGRWIFISTLMTFLALQSDRLILGKLFSLELLGVYTVAFTLADIPRQIVSAVSTRIIFPVVSQYNDLSREQLRTQLMQKRKWLLMFVVLALTILVCFGDIIITTLYDQRYSQAAWMMPILALGIWPVVLFSLHHAVLLAIGKPMYGAWGNFAKFIYMIIAVPISFHYYGLLGAIIVIALNDLSEYTTVAYGMWREKLNLLKGDITVTSILLGLIALVCSVRYFLGFGLPIDKIM